MARGRIIDRDLFSHEELGELSLACRYLYIGLIVFADDEGRLKGVPKFLKAKIFPYDKVSEKDIENMIRKLVNLGLLLVYQVENRWYLEHPKWKKWQPIRIDRFKPSDCPSSVDGIPMVNQMFTNGSPLPNLTKPNLTAETGVWFTDFWKAYPKKAAARKAREVFEKLSPGVELLEKIMAAVAAQKQTDQWRKDDGKYIPHAATWLNQRRWEDELPVLVAAPDWRDTQ